VFGHFYTSRFQLGQTSRRGVMHAHAGRMLGGSSALAHIGSFEEVAIEIRTSRPDPDPAYPAMDRARLEAAGLAGRRSLRLSTALELLRPA
jgi:hypothetical protein